MSYFDETREPDDDIIYRVEVYKLDYDAEADEYCEEMAFCTGYRTFKDACDSMGFIYPMLQKVETGWNPFTTADMVIVNLAINMKSEVKVRWNICQGNIDKIGKTKAQAEEMNSQNKEE